MVRSEKHLQLIGNNLNFDQGVAYESFDRHKYNVHMFASCTLVTDPVFKEKANQPEILYVTSHWMMWPCQHMNILS